MDGSGSYDSNGGDALPPADSSAFSFAKRWIVWAILLAGWGAAVMATVGFAGGIARAADLASHFRVGYAVLMAPALAITLPPPRTRKWRAAAALALAFLLNLGAIGVLYLPPAVFPDPEAFGPKLRLLQFNTWPRNPDDRAVLALIESERPDIASLQETSESLREAIAENFTDKYRIREAGTEVLMIRRQVPEIRDRGGARYRLPRDGVAISSTLEISGREVRVLSLHARAPIGLRSAAIRDAQLEWVARWCRSTPGAVIILGDLNATPWSYPFGRLLDEGGLVDSTRGFGVQPTWRTSYGPLSGVLAWPARIPIDHCLHSADWVTVAREIGPPCGSNHLPLVVTLQATGAEGP